MDFFYVVIIPTENFDEYPGFFEMFKFESGDLRITLLDKNIF